MTATQIHESFSREPVATTLLSLVTLLDRIADDADTTVEAVQGLLRSGRAVLTGNFRGQTLESPAGPTR